MLAAFLKSIGFIIPLMDSMYANYYTREVMVILIREFQTPDEEMKKIVLKVCPLSYTNHLCMGLYKFLLRPFGIYPLLLGLPGSLFGLHA